MQPGYFVGAIHLSKFGKFGKRKKEDALTPNTAKSFAPLFVNQTEAEKKRKRKSEREMKRKIRKTADGCEWRLKFDRAIESVFIFLMFFPRFTHTALF